MWDNPINTTKVMARKERIKVQELIDAIHKTSGQLSQVARTFGVYTSTIYEYRDKYPAVAQAIIESRSNFDDILLDTAERQLAIASNDGKAWAIRYILDKKGEARGYKSVTRQEVTGADGGAIDTKIIIQYADPNPHTA
jgi:hypothetical protein